MRWRDERERGSASIYLIGIGLCLLLFAAAGATVAAAVTARHRAQLGADAAALAAAMRAVEGAVPACARAVELAAANQAIVTDCELSGLDVTVAVTVEVPPILAEFGPVRAIARAGPGATS